MDRNNSLLLDLRKFFTDEDNDKDYFSHMVIAMEVSENGMPIGTAIKMKCSPILALGIIDLLHEKLNESRAEVIRQLEDFEKDNMSNNMSVDKSTDSTSYNPFPNPFDKILKDSNVSLSNDEKQFFNDCQKRALDALRAGDEEELDRITNELREYVEKRINNKKSSDDKGFDINDFKGNF
jgi:hypothetical protein